MRKQIFQLISCLLIIQTPLISAEYYHENESVPKYEDPWFIRLELGAVCGQFIKFDKDYKEIGLFLAPPHHDDLFWFADLRGYKLEGDKYAANLGAGIRWLSPWSRVWGANFYYDYREAHRGHFNQIGIGLESLSPCFDLRINGYFPLNETINSSKEIFKFPSGNKATKTKKELAFKGASGEVGFILWEHCQFNIYGAFGPYYYSHDKYKTICGGYTRLEFHIFDYLTLETNLSYDRRYEARAQGRVVLSIPLDALCSERCSRSDTCRYFLNQPVKRNPLIAYFKKCCDWKWTWKKSI